MATDLQTVLNNLNQFYSFAGKRIVSEEEKAKYSWQAIMNLHVISKKVINTVQYFNDYPELFQKVKVQGEQTIKRIAKYAQAEKFTIAMSYGLALIKA